MWKESTIKAFPIFLQHNFPEWDDKIYHSIWGFKENQNVSLKIIFLIPEMKSLLFFCLISDLYFFSAEAQICNMNIFILYTRRLIVGILQAGAKGGNGGGTIAPSFGGFIKIIWEFLKIHVLLSSQPADTLSLIFQFIYETIYYSYQDSYHALATKKNLLPPPTLTSWHVVLRSENLRHKISSQSRLFCL